MKLIPYQTCRTTEGWVPVSIPSSTSDMHYTVLVCPWGLGRENICECASYMYRGMCRHQMEAMDQLCGWSELFEPKRYVQTEEERAKKICPQCGGPTIWRVEVDDSEEE